MSDNRISTIIPITQRKEWVQDETPFPNNNPRCTAFEPLSQEAFYPHPDQYVLL
jgi:hypothetical protein